MTDGKSSHNTFVEKPALPRSVLALGFVSLFMDTSSELIHSLLPVFMGTILGASAISIGLVEGLAEATASITKIFSGVISDRIGKRKLLTVIGYGLAAITKPLFPIAGSVSAVFTARFIDRIGKGIRGAPRDALIADVTTPELRGAAYGLRQALDTVGAFAGPLLAIALMILLADNIRSVFWLATIPAFISVMILITFVREPEVLKKQQARPFPLRLSELRSMGKGFWFIVGIGAILALARFSEAFLVLHADSVGVPITFVPFVMVLMSLVYSITAYPAGIWSDRSGQFIVFIAGLLVLIAADFVLASATHLPALLIGIALWGLHMGLTQGLIAAMIANAVAESVRGTAFGIFNLISGVFILIASVLAGFLWDKFGPSATFTVGAIFAIIALISLVLVRLFRKRSK